MAVDARWRMHPVPLERVRLEGGFWGPRLEANRKVTIPAVHGQLRKTGRVEALKLAWKPGRPKRPHQFWDSDVAKWLEAASYALSAEPDAALVRRVRNVVRLLASAQQPDGYLNTYFTSVRPEDRWTNLRDDHELYCAGHLIEAAVAHHQATGERELLDVVCRYADLIASLFGRGRGQRRGCPGHEEIEPALVRLYRATGQERYLNLAAYFVNERGRRPHYFDAEARARGEDPRHYWAGSYDYCQAHAPVREQTTAEGHAVRAMYLYCGMADVAAETGDGGLLKACKRLWRNVTERRMYVTGGIGSTRAGERFTCDYDLPNETAYAETCAAVGLVFWAHRMLRITGDGRYADVMERALYNGVLSSISLDGARFFYTNPLAVHPKSLRVGGSAARVERVPWFDCACCPPNIARLLASLPSYACCEGRRTAWVHLYAEGEALLELDGCTVRLRQRTAYPWKGKVRIGVEPERPARFTLALRVPGWCSGPALRVNGRPVDPAAVSRSGYARLTRRWSAGDRVELELPMPVERARAHPRVRACAGRVALQRGPLVYCLEEADNGPDLNDVVLRPDDRIHARYDDKLLGGAVVLSTAATRTEASGRTAPLYSSGRPQSRRSRVLAVPYYAWANRRPGEMLVWVRSEGTARRPKRGTT